jgi:hypothetical protein
VAVATCTCHRGALDKKNEHSECVREDIDERGAPYERDPVLGSAGLELGLGLSVDPHHSHTPHRVERSRNFWKNIDQETSVSTLRRRGTHCRADQ